MSNKKRAQHTIHRRHGDRNVQTGYSRQCPCGMGKPVDVGMAGCGQGFRSGSFCFVPKVNVKIRELHIHMDERMDSVNFNSGCGALIAGDDACECSCSGEEDCHGGKE